jgi:hypothetical protein
MFIVPADAVAPVVRTGINVDADMEKRVNRSTDRWQARIFQFVDTRSRIENFAQYIQLSKCRARRFTTKRQIPT